jgi:Family of unknown function (DUF6221)
MSGVSDKAVEWLRREAGDDHAFAAACLARPMPGSDMAAIAERVAQCEAALAILDAHDRPEHYCPLPALPSRYGQLWVPGPCWTVHLLASGYRHRPGYAEHWGEAG